MPSDSRIAAQAAQLTSNRWGASDGDWEALCRLGLTADLLPVVSNPNAKIHPSSKMQAIGKTPSRYADGMVVGIGGWTQMQATEADIERWSDQEDYGVCVQTRQVKACDIDIADPAIADEVQSCWEMELGFLPVRTRPNSGKRLLVCRVSAGFPKRVIKTEHGIIELLSNGQQFVACGQHQSGVHYTWPGGLPTEIPEVSLAQLDAAWAVLAARYGIDGKSTSSRASRAPTKPRSAADTNDPKVGYLIATGLMRSIDAKGRVHFTCPWEHEHSPDAGGETSTTYMPAGVGEGDSGHYCCKHSHCEHRTNHDFDVATGWLASQFDTIEWTPELEAQSVADTAEAIARAAKRPAPVILETQRERAIRIGREGSYKAPTQRLMTGTEMLEELVFIEEGSRVSFASEPRAVLSFDERKKALAGSIEIATNDAGRKTRVHRLDMWLKHQDRKTVWSQTFAPGRGAFCQSPASVLAQNLWVPRTGTPPANWREISAPFFDHVAYLVPDAVERERFLDWIAHIEQDPGTLPSTHYLLVAKQTGIGRNWLAYALARVFAGHTALGFDLGEALRTGFNGELGQTLLAVVDELHEGGPGGMSKPVAEKLKSLLTAITRKINPKYGRQHVEFNCTRFLMFSNHEAALPLADNDRRVAVVENPSERRSAAYYTELYALLDHPELGAALAEAFRQRDLSQFNPGALAPMNAAKAKTIRAGRSEVEQAVRDVAAEWGSACITSSTLTHQVSQTLGGKTWNVQGPAVAAGLVKYPQRVRVGGSPSHIWILRDAAAWLDAEVRAIAAEVMRGEAGDAAADMAG